MTNVITNNLLGIIMFRPNLILVKNDEYEIAWGFSDLAGSECIGERWNIDGDIFPVERNKSTWFPVHPIFTSDRISGLLSTEVPGKNYTNIMAVAMIFGMTHPQRRHVHHSSVKEMEQFGHNANQRN